MPEEKLSVGATSNDVILRCFELASHSAGVNHIYQDTGKEQVKAYAQRCNVLFRFYQSLTMKVKTDLAILDEWTPAAEQE